MRADNDDTSPADLVLSVPPTAVAVPIARRFVTSVARSVGCDDDTIEDVKLAMSEALTNSIKSHVRTGTVEQIHIVTRPVEEGLAVSVVDAGSGLVDTTSTEAFTPPGGLYEGSLGMALIRSLFPEVEIRSEPGRGTTVRFVAPARSNAASGH